MPKICSVEGCGRAAKGQRLCLKHYKRARRNGEIQLLPHHRGCSIEGCTNNHYANGLCSRHYQRGRADFIAHVEDLPGEIWKDIEGFEGIYKISNLGRVKSLARVVQRKNNSVFRMDEHLVRPCECANGYLSVTLYKDGQHYALKIHRLVCQAFHGRPLGERNEVNHIDGDKANNVADNLEWCTHSENQKHSVRVLGHNMQPVICVETGEKYHCMSDASMAVGLSSDGVSDVIRGRRKTAGGYHWKRLDKYGP